MIASRTIADLQDILHGITGRRLTDEEALATTRAFLSFRDTKKALLSRPKHLFHASFTDATFYNKAVFPCDVLDLRTILKTQRICSSIGLSLWALLTARKIFSDYSCYIVLDFDPKKYDCFMAGGLAVFSDSSIDIRGRIQGVIANGRAPFETIEKIVADTVGFIPVYGEAYTPGIDIKKVASKQKEFIVNMPSLGVVNVLIHAETDSDAVDRALARRWQRLPKSKEEPRPDRFTAAFWMDSPFWETIVKEASSRSIKTAQNGSHQIQLTPEEQQVFGTILAIDKQFRLGQQYRVAGGWVRDRLLGTQSDDIDIALDKMTGQQFLKYAEQYRISNPESQIGKSYVVSANDAKSKHLETTALEMGPFKIDFVNLRSEDYASDSRTPEMKFGTPETDAQRRDLTINSLFYNIGAGQVEDYVGGLEDLKTMTLRTPLDPVQTFMDDPLRILRVLRFNSRYPNAKIAPEVLQAMSDPGVHEAYRVKVSPERAGPEILKLFTGEKPVDSLMALYNTGLDKAILNLPDFQKLHPFDMDQRNPHHDFNVRDHTFKVMQQYSDILKQKQQEGVINKKDRTLALIASWFHDYGKLHPEIGKPKETNPNHYQYIGHEDVSGDLADAFLKQIGIGTDDREFVTTIVREHMTPHLHGNNPWNKRQMGKLRSKSTIPGNPRNDVWKFIMWHAKADDAGKSVIDPESQTLYDERYSLMDEYMNAPPPVKPLLDGQRIMQMFPGIHPKTGFIKDIHTRLLEEQAAENITDIPGAEAYVESLRPEIEGKYMQQPRKQPVQPPQSPPPQPPLQASNWYTKLKQAEQRAEVYDDSVEDDKSVKHMLYYPPGGNSVWSVGDKVRHRRKGLAFKPVTGKVVKKKGTEIVVEWDDTKKLENFSTDSTETMAQIERV